MARTGGFSGGRRGSPTGVTLLPTLVAQNSSGVARCFGQGRHQDGDAHSLGGTGARTPAEFFQHGAVERAIRTALLPDFRTLFMPKHVICHFLKGTIFSCDIIATVLGHDFATTCIDACTTGGIHAPPVGGLRAESRRTGGDLVLIPPGTTPGRSCPGPGVAGGPRLPLGLWRDPGPLWAPSVRCGQ